MSLYELFLNLRKFVRPYRLLVIATLFLTLIGAFAAQVNAWVLRYAVDSINDLLSVGKGLEAGLPVLVTITVILLSKELITAVVQFGQKYYGEKLRILVSHDLAQVMIEKILTYRLTFFSDNNNESGRLQTRIDRGIASLTRLVKMFFIEILPLFANSLIALIMMFSANVYVGLIGLCIIPIYFWIAHRQALKLGGWRRKLRGFRETKSQGIITIIDSIAVIKSFNQEQQEASKQLALQKDLTDNQMQTRRISFLFDSLKSFVEQIGVVFIIIVTAYMVLGGSMTLGAIMFHILLFNNVSAPIRQLQRIYDEMNDALVYSESYFEILRSDEQIEQSGDYRPNQIDGLFELKGVNFTYPNGKQVLHNVNMRIEPNKITAIVGLSGAGKSTIINLLDKFYSPDSGQILLDGRDLRCYQTQSLRENIGLVLQKNHIFSGTIEENIRYGNSEATFEQVVDAAKKAFIHEQIMALPEQYQTKALQLSGGQQQRISIARMFIKDPPIIFLDEPTASLDAIATEQIKNSLDAIKHGRTVIMISHSLSQIIDADYIYVLKEGVIVEEGTHDDVYALEGTYTEIFDAMTRGLNLEKIAQKSHVLEDPISM